MYVVTRSGLGISRDSISGVGYKKLEGEGHEEMSLGGKIGVRGGLTLNPKAQYLDSIASSATSRWQCKELGLGGFGVSHIHV